ncbi:MAG TPA: PP2C family serine/threonine-protein phosphatase [Cellvibrio sp.]|nr:PP2C family serine/threonine-protein phosphatase [Cellvibrio sp.]
MPDFRLPNARADENYTASLKSVLTNLGSVSFLDIHVPDNLGLSADLAAGTLSGSPASAGDFEISLVYYKITEVPAREYTAKLSLLVVPNPKSLWKNLPSDSNAIYWRTDEACSSLSTENISVLASSKRGRSHAHVGSFRDDDYQHALVNDWVITVVADGAGSAKYSRRGAQLICEAAVHNLSQGLVDDSALVEAVTFFQQAQSEKASSLDAAQQNLQSILAGKLGSAARSAEQAIQQELALHSNLQAEYKDFSSTALIAICKQFSFGTLCAAFAVGDGAIAVYQQGHAVTLLGSADSGEFAGQTRFLDAQSVADSAIAARTRFVLVEDLTALLLVSDGVSDPWFETDAQLASINKWDAFWSELIAADAIATEEKLLAWLDFWSSGNHDDRTIVLVRSSKSLS